MNEIINLRIALKKEIKKARNLYGPPISEKDISDTDKKA